MRPFRYDLNQILYNYTVEVTNKFTGFDLIDRVPEELCMEVLNIVSANKIYTILYSIYAIALCLKNNEHTLIKNLFELYKTMLKNANHHLSL